MKTTLLIFSLFSSLSFAGERIKMTSMIPITGHYSKDQNVDYVATYPIAVNVVGTPCLLLNVGSDRRQANYLSGSGSNTIIFRYVVEAGDIDLDGIEDFGMIKCSGRVDSPTAGQIISDIYPGPYRRKSVTVDARIGNILK